jgi:hypothetical protein
VALVAVAVGAGAGWIVAMSRHATLSDAVVSAILTGVFTLLGTAVGIVVPLVQDWERNRPNLKLQMAYECLHASPGFRMASETQFPSSFSAGGAGMTPSWIRCEPSSEGAALFLLLDLQVQNRGHLDDAITEITILVPWNDREARLPARRPDGSTFFGESIPAHGLRHLRLRLVLERENYAKTPNWMPDQSVVWKLVARTINDQTLTEEIRPAGHSPAYEERAVEELDEWNS